ncbi:hypothetical protein P152DRAFT_448959 [Eremomyces bilateralis CBS 781.70]|uniref:Uncharacterized protein n=1 Tax=Eremomyces bilateralis CBS 781.70 TaxID=1392243 RepID=A0A6G1G4A2_9PEZI|nr:uncharacterized protein P152DRAFT_448959 [Eremomyces bilateralis CBS 781.70]KAF1812848.1 hypothetical protein P152DRAFT_448959 [Eremomyces bilateralis CBS 781.70]
MHFTSSLFIFPLLALSAYAAPNSPDTRDVRLHNEEIYRREINQNTVQQISRAVQNIDNAVTDLRQQSKGMSASGREAVQQILNKIVVGAEKVGEGATSLKKIGKGDKYKDADSRLSGSFGR